MVEVVEIQLALSSSDEATPSLTTVVIATPLIAVMRLTSNSLGFDAVGAVTVKVTELEVKVFDVIDVTPSKLPIAALGIIVPVGVD